MRTFHAAFLIGFATTYFFLLAMEIPVLIYYPLHERWSFIVLGDEYGPAMTWYGHVLASLAPAVVFGVTAARWGMPQTLVAAAPLIAVLSMIACAILMSGFFIPTAG